MKAIEIKILEHNLNAMPKFLARLTQQGHKISGMSDLVKLYDESMSSPPSENLLALPHTTIKRMNHLTVAIVGLSTKAVSQIRTHATRLSFVSTSTQYSSYEDRPNNWVVPDGLSEFDRQVITDAYTTIQTTYSQLIANGVDKDKAGYILPQGLRKALIISGNLDAWQYMIQLRICRRNTVEVQHIMKLIYNEIRKINPVYVTGMLPTCTTNIGCREGKFYCGNKIKIEEITL